jgi:hypothetical protein
MGNNRKQGKEQYYTLPEVADYFTKKIVELYGVNNKWLEPSAGTGSFIESLLKEGCTQIEAYDIDPKHPMISCFDFLKYRVDTVNSIAIGNPPFGRACSLAIPFFNKCAESCKVIAFIIPPSFNKPSIQEKLNPYFHQIYVEDVPKIAFYDSEGNKHEGGYLKTQFQIWEKRKERRPLLQNYRSSLFKFVTKDKNPDLAFRTHGSNAGKILEGFDYNPRTTAFIKLIENRAKEGLEKADFSYYLDSTSYIPCLAPAEIAMSVDKYFGITQQDNTPSTNFSELFK